MALNRQELLSKRGKAAALTRSRSKDDPELIKYRAELAEEKLAKNLTAYREAIAEIVSQAPPLTPETQATLRHLLSQGAKL
jgi:hypothetical protein